MSISYVTLSGTQEIATYLANLKDRNNENYFSSVTAEEGSTQISLNVNDNGVERLMAVLNFGANAYHTITAYTTDGTSSTTTQTYSPSRISDVSAFSTKNGACLDFKTNSGTPSTYFGVGRTLNGDTFICFGDTTSRVRRPLIISHGASAPTVYGAIETNSAILNQMTLVTEAVATQPNVKDRWNKYFFNKTSTISFVEGAMTLDGKVYFTNSFISILDD